MWPVTMSHSAPLEGGITPYARYRPLRLAAYGGFISIGMLATVYGAILPPLGRDFSLNLAALAGLFPPQALAYGLATFVGGVVSDVVGRKRLYVGAALIMSLGMALAATAPGWPVLVAAAVLAGAGTGIVDSLTNALFLDLTVGEKGSAGALNLLHTFFGVGALLAPLLAGFLLGHAISWRVIFAVLAVAGAALAAVALAVPFPPSHGEPAKLSDMVRLLTHPVFAMLGAVLALYVGGELVVTDWLVTYMVRAGLAPIEVAASVLSFFWFTLMLGRLLGVWVAARIDPYWLTGGSATLSAIFLLATVTVPNFWACALFAGLTGLCYAVIFPTVFAIAGGVFPRYSGVLSGGLIVSTMGGSLLFPWLTGIIGQNAGLRVPFLAVAALTLLIVPLLVGVKRLAPR